MRNKPATPTDRHDWHGRATDAQKEARQMSEGPEREETLKKADMLRQAAAMSSFLKPTRPNK